MKTISIAILALIVITESEEAPDTNKKKRGSLESSYLLNQDHISLGGPIDLGCTETHDYLESQSSNWQGSHLPFHNSDIYAAGIDKYLPISDLNPVDYNLKFEFPPQQQIPVNNIYPRPIHHHQIQQNQYPISNDIKPVREPQEIVPPQSVGTAVLPPLPPPAVPVNAVASNIPGNQQAIFLGSGSLGVVSLGNGAYALGSGSLGYSDNRSQPQPGTSLPIYPPLAAAPNLLPAAVPSPAPLPAGPTLTGYPTQPISINGINYNRPLNGNRNGYEFLPPNRIGFGSPAPPPPGVRTTQQFATLSAQVPQRNPQFLPNNNIQFDFNRFSSGSFVPSFG